MIKVIIAYHSGYGHTQKVADAIAEGVKLAGANVSLISVDKITDADWTNLNAADAIIFGSPTYMGGVSGPFKVFLDATSKSWYSRAWKDKIAAGFTNSASQSGDKLATLQQLFTTAMQHGMIWVGQAEMGPSLKGTAVPSINDINRVGSYSGLMTQSNNDTPEVTPPTGDLETAKIFGKRVAEITAKFKK